MNPSQEFAQHLAIRDRLTVVILPIPEPERAYVEHRRLTARYAPIDISRERRERIFSIAKRIGPFTVQALHIRAIEPKRDIRVLVDRWRNMGILDVENTLGCHTYEITRSFLPANDLCA